MFSSLEPTIQLLSLPTIGTMTVYKLDELAVLEYL